MSEPSYFGLRVGEKGSVSVCAKLHVGITEPVALTASVAVEPPVSSFSMYRVPAIGWASRWRQFASGCCLFLAKEYTMTTLVRFDPYREGTALQGEMGRFLNQLFVAGNGATMPGVWAPAMDVWQTEDEIVYAFDLPGIAKEAVSIEFEHGALTVSAERERSQEVSAERLYRFERRYGSFSRTIGLPKGVSEDQISARYNNGVLE